MMTIAIALMLMVAYDQIQGLRIPSPTPEVLSQAEKDYILNLHNRHRDNVHVPHLKWNDHMQHVAEEWAKTCNFDHKPFNIYNDNLAASGKPIISNNSKIIKEVVDAWAKEEEYYKNEGNWDCMERDWESKTCGHYTQMVWSSTEVIGCAIIHCSNPSDVANLVVCDYSPSGNYIGETPF